MNSVSKPDYTDEKKKRIRENIEKTRKYRRQEELAMKERIEKDVINNSIKTEEPPAAEKQAAGPVVAEPPEAAGPFVAEEVAKIEEVIKRQNEEKEAAENQTSAAEEMRRKATEAERLPPARLIEENITNGLSNDETRDAEPVEENTPSSTGAVRINEPSKQTVYIKVREPSETVSITANEPSETVRITVREPSETVRITVREPSTDIVQIKVKEPYETVRITVSEPSTNPSYGSILKSAATSVATSVASVASVVSSAFASKSTPSEKKPEDFSKLPILQSDISVTTENITSDGIRNPVYKSVTVYDKEKKITTKHYKISKLSEDEIKKYYDETPMIRTALSSKVKYVYIDRSQIPSKAALLFYIHIRSSPTDKKDEEMLLEKMDSPDIEYFLVEINPSKYYFITRMDYKKANEEYIKTPSPKEYPPILEKVVAYLNPVSTTTSSTTPASTTPASKPKYNTFTDFLQDNTIKLFSYKSYYFQKELIGDGTKLEDKFAKSRTEATTPINKPAIYTEI